MSRVIFFDKVKREDMVRWAQEWASEGSDRVVADFNAIQESMNSRFAMETDVLAYAATANILRNCITLNRHVAVCIDTAKMARYLRLENLARRSGGDVEWVCLDENLCVVKKEKYRDMRKEQEGV